ncbi:MAG: hypothetical protein NW223_00660 [Hyphomicrobiaceae bacterium]|nr:hypothetical protein [Hyphomicrobiaceae bacterium]
MAKSSSTSNQFSLGLPGDKQPAPPRPTYTPPKKTYWFKCKLWAQDQHEQYSHRHFRKLRWAIATSAFLYLVVWPSAEPYSAPLKVYRDVALAWLGSSTISRIPAPADAPKAIVPPTPQMPAPATMGPWQSITTDAEGRPK